MTSIVENFPSSSVQVDIQSILMKSEENIFLDVQIVLLRINWFYCTTYSLRKKKKTTAKTKVSWSA